MKDVLPAGEWVYKFEVMYATILFANAVAAGRGAGETTAVYPIVNLCGRVSGTSPNFCGNLHPTK